MIPTLNLQEVLRLHALWLSGDTDGVRADLCGADLCNADLRGADLRRAGLRLAGLRLADLRLADLRGVDLDYSAWPLSCRSFDVRADRRLGAQLAYHFCRTNFGDDEECRQAQAALKSLGNQFHRIGECGELNAEEPGQ